jgi:hypothetical protein
MKIAFDVHGVLDTFEYFRELADVLYEAGHEVYIISGQLLDDQMIEFLETSRIRYHKYFSITQWLIDAGHEITWKCGLPYVDDAIWNPVKAEICVAHNVDILYDDSPTYKATFDNIETVYNHVINTKRKAYEVRCLDEAV